ncbi:transposase [Mesorhizobium sp. WSM4887]|uniref:transposase n=1 Tax=Mesorhizobium sp. WSM4887 TaxID=3038543 RepID=UPI002415974B|nr:transposase [Mesorhizobium sp. WSM4887]MDG4889892.1 transposase [Mesorhizobium sp. WSM4887]
MTRLVFIDETSTNTRLTKRTGWAPKSERYRTSAPFGGRKTQTFIAGLRCHAMIAPWIVDAPMNRARFELYVETQLAPELKPGDVVILDNVAFHKSERGGRTGAPARCLAAAAAGLIARSQSNRNGLLEAQGAAQKEGRTILRRFMQRAQGHMRPVRPNIVQRLLQSCRI